MYGIFDSKYAPMPFSRILNEILCNIVNRKRFGALLESDFQNREICCFVILPNHFISYRNQQEYCALVIQNWWRLKLNEKRRNVRTPPAPPSTTEDNYSTSSVSLSVSSGPPSRAATRLSGQTSTMISAARVIQKAWRRHVVHG